MTKPIDTPDRFDLEQQILECWRVTDDINLWSNTGNSNPVDFSALSNYYNHKFAQLWATFESMVHEKKM